MGIMEGASRPGLVKLYVAALVPIVVFGIILELKGLEWTHHDVKCEYTPKYLRVSESPLKNGRLSHNTPPPLESNTLSGWRRLREMVSEAKIRFGKRLVALLEATGLDENDLKEFLHLKSIIQIRNYLVGRHGPTFDRMAKLRYLFGVRTGEIDGSEPFPQNLDTSAIHQRIKDNT